MKGIKKMFRETIIKVILGFFVLVSVPWSINQIANAEGEKYTFEEVCEMFGGEYTFEGTGGREYVGTCWVSNEDGSEFTVILDPGETPSSGTGSSTISYLGEVFSDNNTTFTSGFDNIPKGVGTSPEVGTSPKKIITRNIRLK